MQVKISEAVQMITTTIQARLVPMLAGSPGCGKSQIVHQIAEAHNLKLIDLRLSQCDPCDLNGFPQTKGGKSSYLPMDTFPLDTDSVPEGFSGWLLFLDEFSSAPPAVQAAAYKVVLDRKIGQSHLHRNVAIVCAGNLATDGAIVEEMSTAMQSRLVHMELIVCPIEWNEWAVTLGKLDHRITSYIKFKPGQLHTFSPTHSDNTYACPRTWEFTHRLLQRADISEPLTLKLLAGTISEGVAREFKGFCDIYDSLPKMSEIIANPKGVELTRSPSILFALTGAIAHHIALENAGQIMLFVERMPIEFQVVCLRETMRRTPSISKAPAVQAWIAKSAAELF